MYYIIEVELSGATEKTFGAGQNIILPTMWNLLATYYTDYAQREQQ